jgi:hypothetical protein
MRNLLVVSNSRTLQEGRAENQSRETVVDRGAEKLDESAANELWCFPGSLGGR